MELKNYPFDSILKEMEKTRSEIMGNMFDIHNGSYLPPGIRMGMLPALRGEFRVDIKMEANDVIVIADLPGLEKDGVFIELLTPRTLSIQCEHNHITISDESSYYMRERIIGKMRRIVMLPCEVTDEDSTAIVKNGVLEVRLKKIIAPPSPRIEVKGE